MGNPSGQDCGGTLGDRVLDGTLSLVFSRPGGVWCWAGLIVLLLITGYQVAPGRAWINTGWPTWVYFAALGVAGGVVGFLGGQRRFVGAACGIVAGVGALWVYSLALEHWPRFLPVRVAGWVGALVLAMGLIPAVVLYAVCDRLLPRPPEETGPTSAVDR